MPVDETIDIMAKEYKKKETFSFIQPPVFNIDEMDGKPCMASLKFTGCFSVISAVKIDPDFPGMIYINKKETQAPIFSSMPGFGEIVGIRIRGYAAEYDKDYEISYKGAKDTYGNDIPEFTFTLHTLPRINVGERYPEHDELVLQAALEGAVLLKNENNALPLKKGSVVNPFGAGSAVYRLGCLGAGKINPRYGIGMREGIEKYSSLSLNEDLYHYYEKEENTVPPEAMLLSAREKQDCAVFFISRASSEAQDMLKGKGGFMLTDDERHMISVVSRYFSKKVVILNTPYPVETGWIEENHIDAVLWTGLPGMAGGRALGMLLDGSVSPSGKLPNTWARCYEDYPSSKNFITKEDLDCFPEPDKIRYITTFYEEGLYVGYRYFDTFHKDAAYLLGHGLSYTTFEKKCVCAKAKGELGAVVEVHVKNTGTCAGKEAVLIYAHCEGGTLDQPEHRLVAFGKTCLLQPGEGENLTLTIGQDQLKSYSEAKAAWVIEAGKIRLSVGGTVKETQDIYTLEVYEDYMVQKVENRMAPPVPVFELNRKNLDDFEKRLGASQAWTQEESGNQLPYKKKRELRRWDNGSHRAPAQDPITFSQVKEDPSLAEAFVAQMTNKELARLCCGGKTGWGIEESGYAGSLYNKGILEKFGLPDYYFADGNNGLNMNEANIGFPVSTVMCASYNEDLMYREGRAIAKEALDMGLKCILAPAMNIQRNPLCGRHAEYFSEDPYLAGHMAGWQSRGLEEGGVSSCMKHFCANNAETLRNSNHSIMTERTAREMYIRPFEYAFEVHMPDSVMTGYNAVNGYYCADNEELLNGVLYDELKFNGYVMTDWGGYGDEGLDGAIDAGIGWIAPGSMDEDFPKAIEEALDKGTLSREKTQKHAAALIGTLL